MLNKPVGLGDLVGLEDWQKVQNYFAEAIDVTLNTVSLEGTPLTKPSRPTRLCSSSFPKDSKCKSLCDSCVTKRLNPSNIADIKKMANFKCHLADLDMFVLPIEAVGRQIVAYIVLGPMILKSRKSIPEYIEEAKPHGIGADDITDALIEINVFSYSKIYNITNLITTIFSYMAQTGYHKKRLGEIAPEILGMDPVFARYHEERILNSLLKSCLVALNADSGSVMVRDNSTNLLHIKAASKIDDDIVEKTEIKSGEGIAGFAAATAQPILLPKDGEKGNLKNKMRRGEIKSSMIVPFATSDETDVYGVINLNILRTNADFSEKDISLVKELINLTKTALASVQVSTKI